MIEIQNYVPNTLRKNRLETLEFDFEQLENFYRNATVNPSEISVQLFKRIWNDSKVKFIFKCRAEEQDENQYTQMVYEIVLKKYFLSELKALKIFAIFTLYFLYYSNEKLIKVNISKIYLDELKSFILQNKTQANCCYMRVCWNLHQKCFSVNTKAGLRNPIVKPNGEPARPFATLQVNPMSFVQVVANEIKEVNELSQSYNEAKEEAKKHGIMMKRNYVDKHFCSRVMDILNEYETKIDKYEEMSDE